MNNKLNLSEKFIDRHIGPRKSEIKSMLEKIGEHSINELIDKTVPEDIRLKKALKPLKRLR